MPISEDDIPGEELSPDERQPWDRIRDPAEGRPESNGAYRAFLDYCTMGRRREVRKLHQEYVEAEAKRSQSEEQGRDPEIEAPPTTSLSTLYTWSSRYRWDDRAQAWQEQKDWERAMERHEEVQTMQSRHADIARMMQSKLMNALASAKPDELTPSQIRLWTETAVKIERLARGVNTESIDHQVGSKPDRPSASHGGEEGDRYEDPKEMAEVFRILAEDAPEAIDNSDEGSE